jgi:uncharacterized damage-inducible protein DinB
MINFLHTAFPDEEETEDDKDEAVSDDALDALDEGFDDDLEVATDALDDEEDDEDAVTFDKHDDEDDF